MSRKQKKLFEETNTGNFMPANRNGCIVSAAYILLALVILGLGKLAALASGSDWPEYLGWFLFVVVLIKFVLFAKRHSGED